MFFKQFSTTHTKPSKKHFLQCNSLYTPLSMNKKWFISLPTQWRVVGNSVGISNGRYEPKLECPVGRRGSNKENPLWGWGGGCVDIFWTSMFPILLCPRNGDSSPLNTTIGTVWTLLNKLNHDTTHVIQLTLTLKMTTAQVVKMSVTVNNNSPIHDYVHPDDHTQPTFEMTLGFKPFTN